MNLVNVTDASEISSETSLGSQMSDRLWKSLVAGYRRYGKDVRLLLYDNHDEIDHPIVGVITGYERKNEKEFERLILSNCRIPLSTPEDGIQFEDYKDYNLDFNLEEDGYLFQINEVVEEVPQTSLTAVVSDNGASFTKTVSGLDNVPQHIKGRAFKEIFPFETKYIAYFHEGARVFERLDDRLRSETTDSLDKLPTLMVNGDAYVPASIQQVLEDGIKTSNYTLRGATLVDALAAGAILPSFNFEQEMPENPKHNNLVLNEILEVAEKDTEEEINNEAQPTNDFGW